MTKNKAFELAKTLWKFSERHRPEILFGLGVGGLLLTAIEGIAVTPKVVRVLDEEKARRGVETLPKGEVVKAAWKFYIPVVATAALSTTCLIGACTENARRSAALATAYSLSESALREYKEKVLENIGEKREEEIRGAIAQDKLDKDPVSSKEVLITAKGNTLCYESVSARYFKSDIEEIKRALNELNRNLLNEMYVSLNDLYYALGLPNTAIGDDIGWNVEQGLIEINFDSRLSENGEPCLVLNYALAPRYEYYN